MVEDSVNRKGYVEERERKVRFEGNFSSRLFEAERNRHTSRQVLFSTVGTMKRERRQVVAIF